MKIVSGKGKSVHGPGVLINLSEDEIALAIEAYITAHQIYIQGPRTYTVGNELCKRGAVYVDPSGFVIAEGIKYLGKTGKRE